MKNELQNNSKKQSLMIYHYHRDLARKVARRTPNSHDFWVVGGNEPQLPPQPLFNHGQFAVVGCGCLKSLEAAFRCIDWDEYQSHANGYNNVPKMFIVDISQNVQVAWARLKYVCIKFERVDEFRDFIETDSYLFDGLHLPGSVTTDRFISTFNSFCRSDTEFELFRNIVAKATFILGKMEDPEIISHIKSLNDRDIIVYASNIHEHMLSNIRIDLFNELLEQINRLKPNLTYYTSTYFTNYRVEQRMMPDEVIMVRGNNIDVHRTALDKNAAVTHVMLKGARKAGLYPH